MDSDPFEEGWELTIPEGVVSQRPGGREFRLGSSPPVSATEKETTDENGDYHTLMMQKHNHSFHCPNKKPSGGRTQVLLRLGIVLPDSLYPFGDLLRMVDQELAMIHAGEDFDVCVRMHRA